MPQFETSVTCMVAKSEPEAPLRNAAKTSPHHRLRRAPLRLAAVHGKPPGQPTPSVRAQSVTVRAHRRDRIGRETGGTHWMNEDTQLIAWLVVASALLACDTGKSRPASSGDPNAGHGDTLGVPIPTSVANDDYAHWMRYEVDEGGAGMVERIAKA